MSLIAILSAGKHNSSAWLREQLIVDALRTRLLPTDFGIPTERPPQGGRLVHPSTDPVLRYHCRVPEESDE